MNGKMRLCGEIFITFIKIGGFTLGGGYAMLPIIQHEVVDMKEWITEEDMTDFMTLGQAAPGVIGINTATAVGYKIAGVAGGISATLGMVMPSLLIIMLIAAFFYDFKEWVIVQSAFSGVRAAVVALMFQAVLRLSKSSIKTKAQWLVAFLVILMSLVVKVPAQYIILLGIAFGVAYYYWRKLRGSDGRIN